MTTVYITCPEDEAAAIARSLVEERLAACVNALTCQSTYRWDAEVLEEPETVLICKTSANRYEDLKDRVLDLHPYDVPCIERFDEDGILSAYAHWRDGAVEPVNSNS